MYRTSRYISLIDPVQYQRISYLLSSSSASLPERLSTLEEQKIFIWTTTAMHAGPGAYNITLEGMSAPS